VSQCLRRASKTKSWCPGRLLRSAAVRGPTFFVCAYKLLLFKKLYKGNVISSSHTPSPVKYLAMNCFHLGVETSTPALSHPHNKVSRRCKNLRGGAPHKESQPTSEITPAQTVAFHSRIRPRPAHPSGVSRAHPQLSSLHVFTRVQRMRINFCPQHWLSCHLGVY
jgi:hypothetical protein